MAEMVRPTSSGPLSTNAQQHDVVDVPPPFVIQTNQKVQLILY